MYGKLATTCFKYQVYLYGSEAITYQNMYLQVEMYGAIFDDFIRINENGTYQITTCINFVTV